MKPIVLFGVLNWGLGHAGRTIPVIHSLIDHGFNPVIISDGEALSLLKAEFPNLDFRTIKAYNVSYPFKSIILNLIWSSPGIVRAIISENNETTRLVEEYKPHLIISDNRYGFRNNKIKSILICHQINLQHKYKLFSILGKRLNLFLLKRFDRIWIPDFEKGNSIAGQLSDIGSLDIKYDHIGVLSRMKKIETEWVYDIAIVLSGPEPQRSIFEKKLLDQAKKSKLKIILIRGLIDETEEYVLNDNLKIKSHALTAELNMIICQSKLIVARSGYSTVMDLIALGKKAVLIPTPGQSEQEYLAEYLKSGQQFYYQKQDEFDLSKAVLESEKYKPVALTSDNLLKSAIARL